MSDRMLRLILSVRLPECWILDVTSGTDAELLVDSVYATSDGLAQGRFTVYGDSMTDVVGLLETIREATRTRSVSEITTSHRFTGRAHAPPDRAALEVFVEFDPERSIDDTFVDRGFVHDEPIRIHDGVGRLSLLTSHGRERVSELLEEIRETMDADIDVERLSSIDSLADDTRPFDRLSIRQREAFALAQHNGYYAWPRETTTHDLAAELDVSKATYLEHLRKAEAKLVDNFC